MKGVTGQERTGIVAGSQLAAQVLCFCFCASVLLLLLALGRENQEPRAGRSRGLDECEESAVYTYFIDDIDQRPLRNFIPTVLITLGDTVVLSTISLLLIATDPVDAPRNPLGISHPTPPRQAAPFHRGHYSEHCWRRWIAGILHCDASTTGTLRRDRTIYRLDFSLATVL